MIYPTNFDKLYFHLVLFKISLETSSLTHVLIQTMLFNFQVFEDFPTISLLLISSLKPLISESRHGMISIILNLLRCVLWAKMWSISVNVPFELEKGYSAVLGGTSL